MEDILYLFKKHMKGKEGKEWDNFYATTVDNSHSITVTITETAKAQILTSGIEFPLKVTLGDDDYFITNESYDNANGVKVYTNRLVLQNFTKIEKADLKKKTLQDVWNEE